jgi:hypothetical protein
MQRTPHGGAQRERRQRGNEEDRREDRRKSKSRSRATDGEPVNDPPLDAEIPEEIDRRAEAEGDRGDGVQPRVWVLDRDAQREGGDDDPDDHRQVQVAVGITRETHALGALPPNEQLLHGDGEEIEVREPHRRRNRQA